MTKSKLKLTIISTLSTIFSAVSTVNAQSVGLTNPSKYNSLDEVIQAVLSILRPVVVIAFIAMIMFAGWKYLTSQGEPDKIAEARKMIVAAIVGFIIIVIAPSVVQLIATIVGVNSSLVDVR